MSRMLEDLDAAFLPLAQELILQCLAADIPVIVITTRRTVDEQADAVVRGVSWVKHSKHQDGLAIDLAPKPLLAEKNWAPHHPWWKQMGEIGESIGLIWGGRWLKTPDPGHFEMPDAPKTLVA